MASSGYAVTPHEIFGKVFRAFESGSGFARAHEEQLAAVSSRAAFEILAYAAYERVFVAGYHEVDVIVDDGLVYSVEIRRFDRQICAERISAGVAGCYEETAHAGALAQLPGDSGFAAAAAEQEGVDALFHLLSEFSLVSLLS